MTAPLRAHFSALRAQLSASLFAPADEIEFSASIEDRRNDLNRVLRSLGFMRMSGASPGEGTLAALEKCASRLLETAEAYRLAKKLGSEGR